MADHIEWIRFYPTAGNTGRDSNNLIEGDLNFVGELIFQVNSEQDKTVKLSTRSEDIDWSSARFGLDSGDDLRWNIGLNPNIALDLSIDAASGNSEVDLTALQLAGLTFDGGSGSLFRH